MSWINRNDFYLSQDERVKKYSRQRSERVKQEMSSENFRGHPYETTLKTNAANKFRDKFFEQTDNSNAFFGIASGLRKRAEAGDEEAQYKYKAIFDDERSKKFLQPNDPVDRVNPNTSNDFFSQKSRQQLPTSPMQPTQRPSMLSPLAPTPVNKRPEEPEGGYGPQDVGFKEVHSPGTQLSNMEKAGVMGVGFLQGIAQPYLRGARYMDRQIMQNRDTQNFDKQTDLIDTLGQQVKMFRGIIASDTATPARKKKAVEEMNAAMAKMESIVKDQRGYAEDYANWGDNKRVAGSVGEMGLDLLTAGSIRAASKLPAGARALQTFNTGVIGGTGMGATSAVQDDTDVASGAMKGMLFGGALGLAGAAAPSIGKAFTGSAGKGVKVTKTYTKGGEKLTDVVVNGKTTKGLPEDTVAALMNYKSGGLISKMQNPVRKFENKIAPWVGKNISRPVRQQVNRIPGAKKVIDRAGSIVDQINEVKLPYRGLKDAEGNKITMKMDEFATEINKSNSVAMSKLTKDPNFNTLVEILQAPKGKKAQKALMEDLGKFVSKKQDIINNNKLVATGAKIGKIKKVPKGTKVQQQYYDAMNKMTKSPISTLYEAGRIDKYTYEKWMADDDYTRVQREIDEQFGNTTFNGESSAINRGGNVEMKLKGDQSQEAVEPLAALMDFYMRTESSLAKRNFGKYLKEVGQQHKVIGKAKVSSANVKIRKEAIGAMLQNSAFKKVLTRFQKSQNKYIRKIQTELNGLNKEGLQKALKSDKKGMPNFSPEGLKLLKQKDVKNFANSLVELNNKDYNLLKKMIGRRDKKLVTALDELDVIRKDIEISSEFNKTMKDVLKKHADLDHAGKPMLKVWNDGVQELYEVDAGTFRQLNGMSNKVMGNTARAAMQANRILRFGATAGNPSFAAANVVRDFFTSAIHTDDIFATHNPMAVGRSLKETIAKPIGRSTLGKLGKKDSFINNMLQPSDEFQQFLIKNQNITRADLGKQLDATIGEVQKIMGVKRDSPLQTWENVVSGSELFGRYQNFSGTLRKEIAQGDGSVASFSKALSTANRASAKNSINFANQSEYANAIKIMNPYLNAGIQGSRQLGRTLLDKPITASFKIVSGVIAPVMAATYYNLADPERAEVYASMLATNPAEVENNLIFVKGDGNVIKLPLPPGINKFANPFRNAIEAEYVGDQQGFKDNAVDFMGAFNPFGNSKSEALGTLLPQPLIPVVEDVTNHSFFYDDNIVPENMEFTPEEEQYYNSIPQSVRDIANILNISPIKAQHYIRGYTAGVGTGVFGTADKILGRESGTQSFDDQILKRFYKPDANKGVSNTYYDGNRDTKGKDELDGVKEYTTKSLTRLVGQGKIDEASKKAVEYNAEVDRAIDALTNKYGRYDSQAYENGDSMKEIRLGLLEAMKFPVKDGRLTDGSINSRKKIYDERN